MQDVRLMAVVMTVFALFPVFSNAFWRLPCRGRTGVARLDPIVDPGEISGHAHAIHGAGNFGMSADMETLRESSCTSCAIEQDKSAYWTPALYFMHANGSAQIVEEVGGMLAYYLLYGENVTAFPNNFRMIAGDPFQRNFTWPIPDPPKSTWSGAQLSQAALRQKALGFNCLNYNEPAEPSLYRHFLPNKTYLDGHCTDGLRLELMFPSCWNGKDVDSPDHTSHVQYPSLVMDGTCPEGYETRLVSLFYETIWNTYAFKDQNGYFALANGDPTGFGYHGDFMFGWQDGVLQEAVDTCTSGTGEVGDCDIFNLQTEDQQRQCTFDKPPQLLNDAVDFVENGLPGGVPIEWGPAYAMPTSSTPLIPSLSIPLPTLSLGLDLGDNFFGKANIQNTTDAAPTETAPITHTTPTAAAPPQTAPTTEVAPAAEVKAASITTTSTFTSTPTPTPTPTTSTVEEPLIEEIVYLEKDVVVMINEKGVPYATHTGTVRTVSSTTTTSTETSTVTSYAEKRDSVPSEPENQGYVAGHARRHAHHLGHFHKKVF